MLENLLSGVIGAVIAAVVMLVGTMYIQRRNVVVEREVHLLDDVRLDHAKTLLQYLSRVLSREAPESLQNNVLELRNEWARLNRALYLLNAPDQERDQFDDRMIMYLDSLAKLAADPSHRPEVERQRARAKEQARQLLQRLGLAAGW